MIATGGGMRVEHPLPPEGIDLRAELADHQRSRIEQALARTEGDRTQAAKLLRVSPLELTRLQWVTPAGQRGPQDVTYDDLPRLDRGVERISAAVIRRFAAEGLTERQIAGRLGCNQYVVEKVLRMQAEQKDGLRKCGASSPKMPAEWEP